MMTISKASKVILFDFDGTLIDSKNTAIQIFNSMADRFGYSPITAEDVEQLKGKQSKVIIKELGISRFKLPFVIREARKRFLTQLYQLKPCPGIPEMLQELITQHSVGILTSNSKKNVLAFLENNKMEVFDFVYSTAHLFGKGSALKKILKKRKIDSKNAFYVGDETRDVDAAREAGIQVIAVSWGFNSRESLAAVRPDYLIDSPVELAQLFAGGKSG